MSEFPHGYVRQILAPGCKCGTCQGSVGKYSEAVYSALLVLDGQQHLPAAETKAHLQILVGLGLSEKQLVQLSGLTAFQIRVIRSQPLTRIRSSIAVRILCIVPPRVAPGDERGFVDGEYVGLLVDGLVASGMTRTEIAKKILGVRYFQLGTQRVVARKAAAIERAYRAHVGDPTRIQKMMKESHKDSE